jgi:ribonuclease HI
MALILRTCLQCMHTYELIDGAKYDRREPERYCSIDCEIDGRIDPPESVVMRAWTDGACQPNPGHAAWGIHAILFDRIIDAGGYVGEATSNVAEYHALINAFRLAKDCRVRVLQICADSKLVVMQVNGSWKVDAASLVPLRDEAQALRKAFDRVTINHVPREQNQMADALSKEALAFREGFRRETRR